MLTVGYATQDRSVSRLSELGGAGWYRCGIPACALKEAGHDVRLGLAVGVKGGPIGIIPAEDAEIASEQERMRRLWVPDIIVMQRYMMENGDLAVRAARAAGQIVVNDVDDLMWNVPPTNQAWRATHPATHPEANINHYRKILAASDLITVSTPYLAEEVRRFCHDAEVIVLRNAIDLERWIAHPHQEPPRLGWTGVLTHRANDVEQFVTALPEFLGGSYAKQFVHVGSLTTEGAPHFNGLAGLDAEQVDEHPMVPISEWPNQFRHFDVGIVPLSTHKFNRAKSAIKGIEYAAAGIPFVASPSPEYDWLYANYGIGRIARKNQPNMVRSHLRALANPETRIAEAQSQREAVHAFDISKRWREWEQAYESVLP